MTKKYTFFGPPKSSKSGFFEILTILDIFGGPGLRGSPGPEGGQPGQIRDLGGGPRGSGGF